MNIGCKATAFMSKWQKRIVNVRFTNKKTEIRESIFVSQKAEERRILWKLKRVLVLESEDGF